MSEPKYLVVETDIPFGSVYAYRRGDLITEDAVNTNGWQDYVVSRNTKAGRVAQGLPEEEASSGAKSEAVSKAGEGK